MLRYVRDRTNSWCIMENTVWGVHARGNYGITYEMSVPMTSATNVRDSLQF